MPVRTPTRPTTRFTVDEFVRMVEADVFGTERVELIGGRVYFLSQNDPHMVVITKGTKALMRIERPTDWTVIQGTLRIDQYNAPDPDLMLFDVPLGTPMDKRPLPILLVEVSHTTFRKDTGLKLRRYARAAVVDYWVSHLKGERVLVHRDPINPTGELADCRYASVKVYRRGERVPLLARPEASVLVDDLLA